MRVSLEKLYHYRCDSNPNHWWTVADIEPTIGQKAICPHCGAESVVEGIDSHPVKLDGELRVELITEKLKPWKPNIIIDRNCKHTPV